MKASDVVAQLRILAGAYPFASIPPETLAVYADGLKDLDAEDLAAAVARHVRTSPRFPSISELRTLVAEASLAVPDAESILAEIRKAIGDRGYNRPPGDGDLSPVALATVEAVGWSTLCESDNPEALRAHVLRIATVIRKRAVEHENLGRASISPAVPCPVLAGKLPKRRVTLADGRMGEALGSVLDGLRPKT